MRISISAFQWRLIKFVFLIGYFLAGIAYIEHFNAALSSNEFENIDGFTRIVIPDTFLYKNIIDAENFIGTILSSGVKNSFVPSAIWLLADFNWNVVLAINVIFLMFVVHYIERLSAQYAIPKTQARLAILIFLLMPANFYYSIGALKELPMMLFMLALIYHFNNRQFKLMLFYALSICLLRYQMLIILVLFFLGSSLKEKQTKITVSIVLLAAACYPALTFLDVTAYQTALEYRQEYGVRGSIGSVVENIRNETYGLSVIAVIIRLIQSLFEPLLSRTIIIEGGSVSVYNLVHVISTLIFIPFLYYFIKNLFVLFRARYNHDIAIHRLYSILIMSLVFIGSFSFIHHRYLYPIFPLIIIAALIPQGKLIAVSDNRRLFRKASTSMVYQKIYNDNAP